MSHRVLLRPAAGRDLRGLPREARRRIVAALESLGDDPRPPNSAHLTGELRNLRRLRVGRYRVAYEVDDTDSVVRVWALGHRRGFYDRLRLRT